jgi:hypothetical protein
LVKQLNKEHAVLLRALVQRELGFQEGSWRATGLDPEGIDIRSTGRTIRVSLPERVTTPEAMLASLAGLVSGGATSSHGSLS